MKFKLQLSIVFNHRYTVSIQYVIHNIQNTDTIGHYIKKYKTKLKQSIFVSQF